MRVDEVRGAPIHPPTLKREERGLSQHHSNRPLLPAANMHIMPEIHLNTANKNSRALMLILSTFSYLLVGACLFGILEEERDMETREELRVKKEELWKKYQFSEEDMVLFEETALRARSHRAGPQWHFAGALYFAITVVTTVGYGHTAPETVAGKLFCMCFALLGIPLGLITFQCVGERLNTFIAFGLKKIRRLLEKLGRHPSEITPTELLAVSLSIGTILTVVGTWTFSDKEHWNIFEAYYYCVITLSTIGFGDYVPLQQAGTMQTDPGYVAFTLFFILAGLAAFSACVNLLVVRFMAPNADEVTAAASSNPPRAILLEQLTDAANQLDVFGLRRASRDPRRIGVNGVIGGGVFTVGAIEMGEILEEEVPCGARRSARAIREMRERTMSPTRRRPSETHNKRKGWFSRHCSSCSVCGGREGPRRPIPFSVRRQPTDNVEHLLCTQL